MREASTVLRSNSRKAAQRPRATRSISERTSRSTRPGRLSSSQVFSIGRSISRTRSSRVRAFCTKTVCANALNAESTAADVAPERSCPRSLTPGTPTRAPSAKLSGSGEVNSRGREAQFVLHFRNVVQQRLGFEPHRIARGSQPALPVPAQPCESAHAAHRLTHGRRLGKRRGRHGLREIENIRILKTANSPNPRLPLPLGRR